MNNKYQELIELVKSSKATDSLKEMVISYMELAYKLGVEDCMKIVFKPLKKENNSE